jgi:hypothetical protein
MSKERVLKNVSVASAFIVTRPDTQQIACVSKEDEDGLKFMRPFYDLGWISTIIIIMSDEHEATILFLRQVAHPERGIFMELDK